MNQQLLEKGKYNLLKIRENINENALVDTACFQQLAIVFTNIPKESIVAFFSYFYSSDIHHVLEDSENFDVLNFEENLNELVSKSQSSVTYFEVLSQKLNPFQSKYRRTSTHNSHRIILNKELFLVECICILLSNSHPYNQNNAMRNLLMHFIFEYNDSKSYRFSVRKNSLQRIDYLMKILLKN